MVGCCRGRWRVRCALCGNLSKGRRNLGERLFVVSDVVRILVRWELTVVGAALLFIMMVSLAQTDGSA